MAGFDFRAIYQAYRVCRRGKRNTRNAQQYECHLLDQLVTTQQRLQQGCWQPSASVCFVTGSFKPREIHAAPFADRVVHHVLVPRLEVLYEPVFIADSYANRRDKGSHKAINRLQSFMRRVSLNQQRPAYYLQLDIANFFNNIDKSILYSLLQKRLTKAVKNHQIAHDEAVLLSYYCKTLLQHDTAKSSIKRGQSSCFDCIPAYKRLINAPPGTGLPIGDLTSQFFANVYLNELDQYIKHQLKCRFYLRYVDDFILLDEHPEQLDFWRQNIEKFLQDHLKLSLRDSGCLRSVYNGADFLGFIVRPQYRLSRRRVIGHLRFRLDHYQQQFVQISSRGVSLQLCESHLDQLRAVLASYLGHFSHANCYRLQCALWQHYPFLQILFELRFKPAPHGKAKLVPLTEAPAPTSFKQQWFFFKQRFPDFLVFVQTGCYFEAYNQDALSLQRLSYRLLTVSRTGFEHTFSLPLMRFKTVRARLRRLGLAHVFIAEQGYYRRRLKRRAFRLLWHAYTEHGLSNLYPKTE